MTRRWMAQVGVLAGGLAWACLAQAGKPTVSPEQSARQADLVIVGKIIGMADTKPQAKTRKHLEVHRIEVLRTLKGVDCAGKVLAVRPNGLLWEDGKSYVIHIRRPTLADFCEAAQQMRTEATQANMKEAMKAIAAVGGSVQPRPALWMVHKGGWGAGVLQELRVSAAGDFQYVHRPVAPRGQPRAFTRLAGKLPAGKLKELRAQVAAAGKGPMAEDAGYVLFGWTDEAGKRQGKGYSHPREAPCAGLLALVDKLARAHGRPPKEQPASRPAPLTAEQAKAAAALIARLGAADFRDRQAATEKLIAMGEPVRDLLEAKAKEKALDPELAARLAVVLEALDRAAVSQAGEADIQVARKWCEALLAGKVDEVLAVTDVPFSWDRKEQVATADNLRAKCRGVVEGKGVRDVKVVSADAAAPDEAAGALDKHRELGGRGGRLVLVAVKLQRDTVLVIVRQDKQPKVVGFSD